MFEDVCCFTGHRYLPADRLGEIKKRLEAEAEACIRQGVILFETGGAWASTPWPLTPFSGCGRVMPSGCGWSSPAPNRPSSGKKRTSWYGGRSGSGRTETVTVSPHYFSGCMHRRNRWLVEHSGRCICCLGRETGGTAYTVRYARQRGLPVVNVWPGSGQILPLE